LRTLPRTGCVVVNAADEALARVLRRGCWTPIARFAASDGWSIGEVYDDGFAVMLKGSEIGRVRWALLGEHNRLNALAALAAVCRNGVAPGDAIEALSGFRNVRRRMELRGAAAGVTVYDDFAHHPTAIQATLEGLRASVGGARIIAVLEPRSNTMKLGIMKDALANSLREADAVFCYSAELGWDVAGALEPLGRSARAEPDFARLLDAVSAESRAGDHVLIMSNGGFNGIHDKLMARLRAREPSAAPAAR
jgi:UDP-N-acetylmuramate: L-alanyl-gamma-D-glutamyl-meso-diaminopimelate ligase